MQVLVFVCVTLTQTFPHHVPYVVSQPVDDRVAATDKLQMFGFRWFLRYQENHKARWHKGHGGYDEDGDHHICALQPGGEESRGEEVYKMIELREVNNTEQNEMKDGMRRDEKRTGNVRCETARKWPDKTETLNINTTMQLTSSPERGWRWFDSLGGLSV